MIHNWGFFMKSNITNQCLVRMKLGINQTINQAFNPIKNAYNHIHEQSLI
ncbi:MAG: hypothetical protein RLZZ231_989 [Bacteroidota bacterium]